MLPRGVTLNNPGNLKHGDPWQGLLSRQTDDTFCAFKTAVWGFRAQAATLIAYQDGRGAARGIKTNTIASLIPNYAPAADNNNVSAYIAAVCRDTGFADSDAYDVHKYEDAYKLCRALTIHEQGSFERFFTKSQLDEGLRRAGVEGVPVGIGSSIARSAATIGAAAGAYAASNPDQIANVVNTVKPIVDASHFPWVQTGFGAAAGVCCGLVIFGEIVRIMRGK